MEHRVQLSVHWVYAALAMIFAHGLVMNTVVDPDLWHEISLVREVLRSGALPQEDPFAYTPTVRPLVHHEWGCGVVLYAVIAVGKAPGLLLLRYLLSAAVAVVVVHCARRRGAGPMMVCVCLPIAIFMGWIGFTTVRAQMFTLLGVAMMLLFIDHDRRGGRRWIIPALIVHVLWLNLHGGFVVGPILLFLHTLEQAWRRAPLQHLLGVMIAMGATVLINPYGMDYIHYLRTALTLDRPLITEWAPLWQAWPPIVWFYGLSLLLVIYALARGDRRKQAGVLLVMFCAAAALRHQRHLSIYAVVWACTVPAYLQATPLAELCGRLWTRHVRWISVMAAILTVLNGAGVVMQRPWHLPVPVNPGEHDRLLYPGGAVAYLREHHFTGNLMTPFTVGAYVTWQLYPAVRVSLDGRYEVAYAPGLFEELHAFYAAAPGWQETLERYPTDAILLRAHSLLINRLAELPGWRCVYRDDAYHIVARGGLPLPPRDHRGQRISVTFP